MTGRARRVRRWIIGGTTVLLVVAIGGPLIYNQVVAAPAMLTLPTGQTPAGAATAGTSLGGRWHVGPRSTAGFRVTTGALGYRSTVIGRTGNVRGSITVAANTVIAASFTVDVASINTSASARALMGVSTYRTASFVLAHPLHLAGTEAVGTIQHYLAAGALTIHGVINPVSITLSDERLGSTLYVLTDIPITFADWHISVPYGVENSGALEVLLDLSQGAGNGA